jgi:hypothetical protein
MKKQIKEKVKITLVTWELSPVYSETYVDMDVLEAASKLAEDELPTFLEEITSESEKFIYTYEIEYEYNGDYDEPTCLQKTPHIHNENSIYFSHTYTIDDNYVVDKDFDEDDISNIKKEYDKIEVNTIKEVLRDKKIEKIIK